MRPPVGRVWRLPAQETVTVHDQFSARGELPADAELTLVKLVLDVMPHDADYYRARAIEERGRAEAADRVYLARLHRELAEQLDRRADECHARAEEFDELAERAAQLIKKRQS